MSIEQIFAGRTMELVMKEDQEHDLKAVTLRMQESDKNVADYLSKSLQTTRQDVLSEIVHNGLKEALLGYCKASNFDQKQMEELWFSFYITDKEDISLAVPSIEGEK